MFFSFINLFSIFEKILWGMGSVQFGGLKNALQTAFPCKKSDIQQNNIFFHGCLSDSAQNDKKATCQKGYWCLYGSCQSAYIPSHDIQKYCAPWWYHSRQAVLHSSTKIAGAWGCQISQQVYSSKIILPLMEKNWPPISSSPCLCQPQRHLHWWQ